MGRPAVLLPTIITHLRTVTSTLFTTLSEDTEKSTEESTKESTEELMEEAREEAREETMEAVKEAAGATANLAMAQLGKERWALGRVKLYGGNRGKSTKIGEGQGIFRWPLRLRHVDGDYLV